MCSDDRQPETRALLPLVEQRNGILHLLVEIVIITILRLVKFNEEENNFISLKKQSIC